MSQTASRALLEILPDEVKDFIASRIIVGDMTLPCRYPEARELDAWQVGFRTHGRTGESLVSRAPGAWQQNWYVIAINGADDPFFIDIGEESSGFPVYHAPHGAGRWEKTLVAPSLRRFGELLSSLTQLAGDHAKVARFIETETDNSGFWRGLRQEHEERRTQDAQAEQPNPAYDPADYREGILVITDVGPNKMKVVQLLRRNLALSAPEALLLVTQHEIPVAKGAMISVRRIQRELALHGASTEFRPIENKAHDR